MNIGIYGAGAVGCYLGGRLAAQHYPVTFLTRSRSLQVLSTHGLTVSDFHEYHSYISPDALSLTQQVADIALCDVILICVKSADTEQVAYELKPFLADRQPVIISFQNGVSNTAVLRSILTDQDILEGMVPFNIAEISPGHYHQGSDGTLMVKRFKGGEALGVAFQRSGLKLEYRDDMPQVQWAKILLNLNNAINALSYLPLKQQLSNRTYRKCLAMAQREALQILAIANIEPAKLTPLSAAYIPQVLSLPNTLFKLLSGKMLAIDPLARSSMQDDLRAGKITEIDWINGEVVRLAQQHGHSAPVNAELLRLVKQAEQQEKIKPLSAEELWDKLCHLHNPVEKA